MAGDKQKEYFRKLVREAGMDDVPVQLLDGESHAAICAADAVMVASGTASLEVALYKKPMVIAYKMMRASWEIMRHMGYQPWIRSEEHTSELQSRVDISYAVFCLKK